MKIYEILIPALKSAFPNQEIRFSVPPNPVAVFPAACPEVGEVQIYDDDDEATVCIEYITHYHENCYDYGLTEAERFNRITENVIEFLLDLFDDTVLLYSYDKGRSGGGCISNFDGTIPDDTPGNADLFVWSKRIGYVPWGRATLSN